MVIKNNKSLIDSIESLIETNNLNMSLSDMFSELVGNQGIANKKEAELITKRFNISEKDYLLNKYKEYFDIDFDDEDNSYIFDNFIDPSIQSSDINKYLNNPYYKNIKIENVKFKDYEIITDHYEEYELFPYLDIKVDKNYVELNSFSFFNQKFPFIAINHKGVTWMSITPNEIETMEKAVKAAYGDVVVYGLGLGYYPYMISLKEIVNEIVIVEKDKDIIELFKKYILPQFKHKEKITIINADAFEYMQETRYFDCAFVDLWHDPLDGIELYLKTKKTEKEETQYFYWLESSFYALLRRCFISLLEEQLSNAPESAYQKSKCFTDTIINTYYKKTKNLVLDDEQQLQDLLRDSNLLNMLI